MPLIFTLALAGDPPIRLPVVPVPEPAGALPSPYEQQLVVPAVDVPTRVLLQGRASGIDVTGLALGAASSSALARQLACDPRWRVVDWEGGRVAYQRVADGKEWTVPLRGYHVSSSSVWRTAVVLRPRAATSVWTTSPLVSHADAAATAIAILHINYEGDPSWRAVAWEWGDPGATLEVFEAGPMATVGELVRTTAALRGVPSLMSGVSRASEEIIGAGCTATLLPGRSARTGEPTATLLSPAPGEIDLRAWLHTPGEGITWARILDTELVPWEEAAVAAGTREILGSSNDSKQLFYLQGRFPVPAGAEFSGTVEFWFQADAGGDPRRIGAFPITVPSR